MRLLLDNCVEIRATPLFAGHEVVQVVDRGWQSIKRATVMTMLGGTLLLPGCIGFVTNYSGTFADTQSDQPWIGPGVRATAEVRVRADPVRLDQRLIWSSPDGRECDAEHLVTRCETYLRKQGIERDPQGADEAGTPMPAHRWGPHGEALIAQLLIYPDSPIIVCADPLIVVICPEPRTVPRDAETAGATDAEARGATSIRHTLQRGYQRGTTGHCDRELRWFSPDLDRGPESMEFSASDVAAISTEWGSLEFVLEGGHWTSTPRVRN